MIKIVHAENAMVTLVGVNIYRHGLYVIVEIAGKYPLGIYKAWDYATTCSLVEWSNHIQ